MGLVSWWKNVLALHLYQILVLISAVDSNKQSKMPKYNIKVQKYMNHKHLLNVAHTLLLTGCR